MIVNANLRELLLGLDVELERRANNCCSAFRFSNVSNLLVSGSSDKSRYYSIINVIKVSYLQAVK